MSILRARSPILAAALSLSAACFLGASDEPTLTEEEMRQFLLTAKVVKSRPVGRGITAPLRLTLSDGKLTHDAAFQAVDIRKPIERFPDRTEINFRDSYHFNIAAYELSKLLGLNDMCPVTVQRNWAGKTGALSWWVNFWIHESERIEKKLEPPDPEAWNQQMHKVRVFAQLVYDTDRNLGNLLITRDWKLWMIDFTRAFRHYDSLKNQKDLVKCDQRLLEKLRQLNEAEVAERTKPHLGKAEVKALMERRDKMLAHFREALCRGRRGPGPPLNNCLGLAASEEREE